MSTWLLTKAGLQRSRRASSLTASWLFAPTVSSVRLLVRQTEDRIIASLKEAIKNADAFVVSDYDKGVVTPRILAEILPLAYEQMPVLIDPKMRNLLSYRPATLVTPNHHEALRMTNLEEDSDGGLHRAAQVLREKLDCDAVLITRGDRGMMLLEGDGDPVYVETAAREVYDVTGAGDTVIASAGCQPGGGSVYARSCQPGESRRRHRCRQGRNRDSKPEELLASFDQGSDNPGNDPAMITLSTPIELDANRK